MPAGAGACLSAYLSATRCGACASTLAPTRLPRALPSPADKLSANVSYPLRGLRLDGYVSPESGLTPADCVYDLYAVSNHYGNLSGERMIVQLLDLHTAGREQGVLARRRKRLAPTASKL